jgi:putative CocE/NonD family hydrolase
MTEIETETGRGDIPRDVKSLPGLDHDRREVMVPMRDGARLFTVILVPKGATQAPMVLDRTPYGAKRLTSQSASQRAPMSLYAFHAELFEAGYILVLQDVRGKYQSEGDYSMNRPLRGPFNGDGIDHSTDAWDTIAWLVANVPECNGRVGVIGISYDGFTALMSLVEPHPALRAAVAMNPMVDNWRGDDWFHNGAFRQTLTLQYTWVQTASKASELRWPVLGHDEYEAWMEAGSAGGMARRLGIDALPFWQRLSSHPAYDDFWRLQAVDRLLAERPLTVPTMFVRSQWDCEDSYGPMAAYAATAPRGGGEDLRRLVIGPWSHPGVGFHDGGSLGPIRFGSDTARHFRREMMLPFLDGHLREGAAPARLAPVTSFETGSNTWRSFDRWPPAGAGSPEHGPTPLYLADGQCLAFEPPAGTAGHDEYVSDPAKPVTYTPRPIRPKGGPGSNWDAWLVEDQRFAADRPDVLCYCSAPLGAPLHIAGQPVAHLFASTSGGDCDWVVKLIDVYPPEVSGDPALGSYQLPVAMEILRARYRNDPARPEPVPPGQVLRYEIALPHVSHAFLPGHRIMVQVQSSWFPLYDRNPQRYVDNIFLAQPGDYVKTTQQVHRGPGMPSRIELPVVR